MEGSEAHNVGRPSRLAQYAPQIAQWLREDPAPSAVEILRRARLAGYRRGLEAAGIPFDERLVIHTSFDKDGGALGIDSLLGGPGRFTAVACANDPLAMGALARLIELGIDVPRQVSVAGFDDIPVAAITTPSLSTVRLPLREMGRRGFAEAARVLGGEELTPTVLPTVLAMRGSTAAPAAVPLLADGQGVHA